MSESNRFTAGKTLWIRFKVWLVMVFIRFIIIIYRIKICMLFTCAPQFQLLNIFGVPFVIFESQ